MKYCSWAKAWACIAILFLCSIIPLEIWVEPVVVAMAAIWMAMLNMARYKRTYHARKKAAEQKEQEIAKIKKMLEEFMNENK